MGKKRLGRGLDALLSVGVGDNGNQPAEISIGEVVRRADQPRKQFNEAGLEELVASIQQHGVLQPILVRPVDNGLYEVIAGERRLRAAERAGLEYIPAVVKEIGEREAAEIALIENLQREDLNPVEEALAYRKMVEGYGYTQDELARRIGKSRPHVANTMRLLNLCGEVLEMLEKGELLAGHARAILAAGGDRDMQVRLARAIVEKGMNVREAERVSRPKKVRQKANKLPEILEVEERLQHRFGTKASIQRGKRGGRIEIFFYNDEDLERILDILKM